MTAHTRHYLRADAEADLIAALPMLRHVPEPGAPEEWIRGGEHHCLVTIPVLVLVDAVMAEDGDSVIEPAVLSPHWHANLLLLDSHPQRDAILAAIEPFVVDPSAPRYVFS